MKHTFALLLLLCCVFLSSLSFIYGHVEQVFSSLDKIQGLIPAESSALQQNNNLHKVATLQWKLDVTKVPTTTLCKIIKDKKFDGSSSSVQEVYDAVVANLILKCGDETSAAAGEFMRKQLVQIIGQPTQMNIK